ncbi:putative 4'-phosphopantetheinyl transferase [Hyphomonas neptunium ATCC 15444]|uniref:Putative 4'-phosphopantetheinyl transferase n=2 Tax=Hyphomonas TaxID=85 RepID=Q0C0K0_HYPNA|nr:MULTISPECIES: 4'-phosphopantetheinyl transferase superfamily protein [Hyphomonas]ABI77260.1 putative 4'-phosphopantetheinyl transferase [Hyphomonas neptunium ATCC 15444]KCZ87561.1 putative 4'-phosphopantetheinyl transferase [Hyphomonas hirschiana VP5]
MIPADELPVSVWVWDLDIDAPTAAALSGWLSPDERQRAAAFATSELQRRWIAARAGMRGILGTVLNVRPNAPVFALGKHGRPYLTSPDCPYSFNLSHSNALAAFAVCDAVVGVDVEQIKALPEGVAGMVFSPPEIAALEAEPETRQAEKFFQFWAAKEAVLKALGTGLTVSGRSFTLDVSQAAAPRLIAADWANEDTQAWRLLAFDPMPGFTGAIAVRTTRPLRLTLKHWVFDL